MKAYPKKISEKIQNCLESKKPFVMYRKSKTDKIVCLIQNNNELYTTKSFDKEGFVMAPFDREKEAVFFPSSQSEKEIFIAPVKDGFFKEHKIQSKDSDKKKHLELVEETLAYIRDGEAEKIVISRKIEEDYDRNQIGAIFEKLLNTYPNAFVYIWNHPKAGLWMGATPEKMLFVQGDSYSTMSLAGTQLKSDSIIWNKKEKQEQQWVTDFITDQLIPISHHMDISKPYTDFAGHLAHIRTDIDGILSDGILLKDIIYRIHPTPAVCGMPRNIAKDFILKNEGYKRDYYTGFLGEINLENQTDLYVNIRCMQFNKTCATLYIGGGITKDSIPEDEWKETSNKAEVLGKFL